MSKFLFPDSYTANFKPLTEEIELKDGPIEFVDLPPEEDKPDDRIEKGLGMILTGCSLGLILGGPIGALVGAKIGLLTGGGGFILGCALGYNRSN